MDGRADGRCASATMGNDLVTHHLHPRVSFDSSPARTTGYRDIPRAPILSPTRSRRTKGYPWEAPSSDRPGGDFEHTLFVLCPFSSERAAVCPGCLGRFLSSFFLHLLFFHFLILSLPHITRPLLPGPACVCVYVCVLMRVSAYVCMCGLHAARPASSEASHSSICISHRRPSSPSPALA
ncbi:hypothetical protein B0I35DRAFT_417665, partial [Stachybotrys elegans]